jgi:hypothetical protein
MRWATLTSILILITLLTAMVMGPVLSRCELLRTDLSFSYALTVRCSKP